MNHVVMTGRLASDPEPNISRDGETLIYVYIVAVGRGYKDKKSGEYLTDFLQVKDIVPSTSQRYQYIKKGDLVEIIGTIHNNNYEKDGKKIYHNDIIINKITKHSSPSQDTNKP